MIFLVRKQLALLHAALSGVLECLALYRCQLRDLRSRRN
jgi:hypothetical protein